MRAILLILAALTTTSHFDMVGSNRTGTFKYEAECKSQFDKKLGIDVFSSVSKAAEYPGGSAAWTRFLNKNLVYPGPLLDPEPGNDGNINISFIVLSSGELTRYSIQGKEDSEWTALDSAAVNVLKKSGRWLPAECRGKKVAAITKLPLCIHFESE